MKQIKDYGELPPPRRRSSRYKWTFWEYFFGGGLVVFAYLFMSSIAAGQNGWGLFFLLITACMAAFLDREHYVRIGVYK